MNICRIKTAGPRRAIITIEERSRGDRSNYKRTTETWRDTQTQTHTSNIQRENNKNKSKIVHIVLLLFYWTVLDSRRRPEPERSRSSNTKKNRKKYDTPQWFAIFIFIPFSCWFCCCNRKTTTYEKKLRNKCETSIPIQTWNVNAFSFGSVGECLILFSSYCFCAVRLFFVAVILSVTACVFCSFSHLLSFSCA